MIHRKHRLEIREFERRVEEICRDVASTVVSTATEYTMRLRREVALRMVDAKTALREGRVEDAVRVLDELLVLLDL